MSLKRNIIANYVSQVYVIALNIGMMPLCLKYMGAEAYGLIGFFATFQAWFTLLDMGLTPTMARETARFRGGAIDALAYRRLVRALEGVFATVAAVGGIGMFVLAKLIARDWLIVTELAQSEVRTAVQLMAGIIALRWMCGLYRGAVSGSERLVWLGTYTAAIATLRSLLVIPVLIFVGATPTIFFVYQFVVALVELAVLAAQAYSLFPSIASGTRVPWSWQPLKPVLRFSLTIAFASAVWVMLTQTDKLILSKLLPLADFGYFTLAVLVASGVGVVSGPVSGALMPRMAKLEAEGAHAELIRVYRQSTQLVAVIAAATSITIAFCSERVLLSWTGDPALAQRAAPVLSLYALGNGVLAVSAFPYYLQYAKGNLRLHLIGNGVYLALFVPTIAVAASYYGAIGAGWTWLGLNSLSFVLWLPFVHRKFAPGLNSKWYRHDVLPIFAAAAITGGILFWLLPGGTNRWWLGGSSAALGFVVMVAAAAASSDVCAQLRARMGRFRSVHPREAAE